jgi:hypothetical protein
MIQEIITAVMAIPVAGWAFIAGFFVCMTIPITLEYNAPEAWTDTHTRNLALCLATVLGIVVGVLIDATRIGMGIGIAAGITGHFGRYLLAKLPWLAWLTPVAKP